MHVQREMIRTVPRFTIDGTPAAPGFARLQQPNYWAREKLDQFMHLGCDLFFVQLGELGDASWCWNGEDSYDYRQYELHLRAILEKHPAARFIPYVGGKPPALWQSNHPDEMILREDGRRLDIANAGSPPWRADSTDAVRRFVEHFEASDLASHIAGYNLIYDGNEWLLGYTKHTDFSTPARARFRQWLRDAYRNDLTALRRAWKDTQITFETADVPRAVAYEAGGMEGMFERHEQRGCHASDYLQFFNRRVADLLLSYACAVKEASDRRKLVSVMFGYTYSYPIGQLSPAHSGHMDTLRVLESPDVDLLHAPYDYYNRCLGGGHYSQYTVDSILLHGKVFADQIDSKTHVHVLSPALAESGGNANTPWESEQILKRDVSFSLTRNAYHYYYEMCPPCWGGRHGVVPFRRLDFSPANVQEIMRALEKVSRMNAEESPASATEVALFTSRQSNYYRAYDKRYAALFLQALRSYFLPYTAVPIHEYFLEDFERIPHDYKVYLFPDANYVPAGMRASMRARLERAGATAVWFYAPGYLDEDGASGANMEELTGMRLGMNATRSGYLMVGYDTCSHPILQGLESPGGYGSDMPFEFFQSTQEWLAWPLKKREEYQFSPFFFCDDSAATVLGTLRGSSMPGLAIKQAGGMTSIFSAAPCPPPELLRNIFRHAGVHLYSDHADIVYANQRYVTLCCRKGGKKTLRLPRPVDVYDALDGRLLARQADRYTFMAQDKQVDIFLLA